MRNRVRNGRNTIVLAAIVFVVALGVTLVPIVVSHQSTAARQREIRAASILLARAMCEEVDVVRQASLARTTDPAQRASIRLFYRQLQQPISDALKKLGGTPCSL